MGCGKYRGLDLAWLICKTFANAENDVSDHIWRVLDNMSYDNLTKLYQAMQKELEEI